MSQRAQKVLPLGLRAVCSVLTDRPSEKCVFLTLTARSNCRAPTPLVEMVQFLDTSSTRAKYGVAEERGLRHGLAV